MESHARGLGAMPTAAVSMRSCDGVRRTCPRSVGMAPRRPGNSWTV